MQTWDKHKYLLMHLCVPPGWAQRGGPAKRQGKHALNALSRSHVLRLCLRLWLALSCVPLVTRETQGAEPGGAYVITQTEKPRKAHGLLCTRPALFYLKITHE